MLSFKILDDIFSSEDLLVNAPITFYYKDNKRVTLENKDSFVLRDDYIRITKKEYEYVPVVLDEPSRVFKEHHIVIPYAMINSVEFNGEEIS